MAGDGRISVTSFLVYLKAYGYANVTRRSDPIACSIRNVTMDQREELRSLYSVVCPRCETVSQADDLLCPYCGADRHGAVLTRGHASLLDVGIDDSAQAMLRAASVHVKDDRPAGQDGHEPGVKALASPPPTRLRQSRLVMVLAVGVCFVLGAYAWIRTASYQSAGQSKTDVVSSGGTVRGLAAPVAPTARVEVIKKTPVVAHEDAKPLAQDGFLATTRLIKPVAFSGLAPHALPCIVVTGPTSLSDTPWCDKPAAIQGELLASKANSETGAVPLQTVDRAARNKVSVASRPVASHSTNTRGHSSDAHARATTKSVRGKPEPQPVRRAAKNDKTHARTGTPQRAAIPAQKKAAVPVPYVEKPKSIPPPVKPGMTSSGSWTPSTAHEPSENRSLATQDDTSITVRGRGEAH